MSSAELQIIHPLAKLLPGSEPVGFDGPFQGLRGETISLQVAYRSTEPERVDCSLDVSSDGLLPEGWWVRNVPCELPAYADADDRYLTKTPSLLPDRLEDPDADGAVPGRFVPELWQSAFVDVHVPADASPRAYVVSVEFTNQETSEIHAQIDIPVEVLDGPTLSELPTLPRAEWLHVDCVAEAHDLKIWSDEHWLALENYIREATAHHVDSLLTPLLTPPLDTAVGTYRAPVQLVDVTPDGDGFQFGFDRLERWLELAERCSVKTLEVAQLFTQWGARSAPQVRDTDGNLIFGWDTDGMDPKYVAFLDALLPAFIDVLHRHGWEGRYFFHVSDEPTPACIDRYREAVAVVRRSVGDAPIREPISHVEMLDDVPGPIVSVDALDAFIEAGATDIWGYVCCAQGREFPNMFIAMSGARTRIIGTILFVSEATGFLHWGYNFFKSQFSRRNLNPAMATDSGLGFQSGDAFLVYPGPDLAPESSLRMKYLRQAFDDHALLAALGEQAGREAALDAIREANDGELPTWTSYPEDPDFFARLRTAILQRLT